MNPRRTFRHVRDFQSRSLDRSDTSPRSSGLRSPKRFSRLVRVRSIMQVSAAARVETVIYKRVRARGYGRHYGEPPQRGRIRSRQSGRRPGSAQGRVRARGRDRRHRRACRRPHDSLRGSERRDPRHPRRRRRQPAKKAEGEGFEPSSDPEARNGLRNRCSGSPRSWSSRAVASADAALALAHSSSASPRRFSRSRSSRSSRTSSRTGDSTNATSPGRRSSW